MFSEQTSHAFFLWEFLSSKIRLGAGNDRTFRSFMASNVNMAVL